MNKIPKVIHFCWFGKGEYNNLIKQCMKSWEVNLPDYKIIEWNEENFDIHSVKFVKEAYDEKKWAFVSDYVRLYALYNHGGIYFDTDLEILKPLDDFLYQDAFIGFESNDSVQTAIMGCKKGHKLIGECLDYYTDRSFILDNGDFDMKTNVVIMTNILNKKGMKLNGKKQTINNLVLYPQRFFAPNRLDMIMLKKPRNSYTIHHLDSSWVSDKSNRNNYKYRIRKYLVGKTRNIVGTNNLTRISKTLKNV